MTDVITPLPASALSPEFFKLLTDSYAATVGKPLVTGAQDAAWLYGKAPFALLAHDTQADPMFIYANVTAQCCFGYSWDEFMTIPSRLSAEAPNQEARQHVLDAVARDGFISNYRGKRIAKSGRRFWIEGTTVWQLNDASVKLRGQAALFTSWTDV